MAIPRVLKNFNLFVDGRGYAGLVSELELPELSIQEEEYRGGGMDVPVKLDMGQEAMEATFKLADPDENALRLWGLADGGAVQFTARGALQRDGEAVVPIVVNLRGSIPKLAMGSWKAGDPSETDFTMSVRYYRYNQGGEDLIEIDAINMIRKVGGVDQLQGIRQAIGV